MKVIEQDRKTGVLPQLSLISIFRIFPNPNVEALLYSISKLSIIHEVILISDCVENELAAQKILVDLLKRNSNLLTCRLVKMNSDSDKGPAYLRNLGATLAKSSILLFADDDAVFFDDITPLLKYIETDHYVGVQPLILRLAGKDKVDSAGDFVRKGRSGLYSSYSKGVGSYASALSDCLLAEEIASMRSAFMIIRKDAFFSIEGFDVSFSFNFEDVDLGWRLVVAGYRLLFVPTVRVLHKGGKTVTKLGFDDRLQRLEILNRHAAILKVLPLHFALFVLLNFETALLEYEFQKLRLGSSAVLTAKDFVEMHRLFSARLKHVVFQRQILARRFKFRGRKRLEDMARGKRFYFF